MKKLIVVSCIALAFIACKRTGTDQSHPDSKPDTTKTDTMGMSLNGIDSASAVRMIAHYDSIRFTDTKPAPVSVWFSKDMIHDMVNLLFEERKMDKLNKKPNDTDQDKGLTDGVRIYFACNASLKNPHLSTSIILVSTKDDGKNLQPDSTCITGRLHKDYYKHRIDSSLFKLTAIKGDVCNGGGKCVGDSLYLKSKNTTENDCRLPHYIPRATAEKMVKNFKKHIVNTTSEWFDIWMWQAIDEDPNCRGVRIYFATNLKGKHPAYSQRDAFIITTTKPSTADGSNTDYFDCSDASDYKRRFEEFYHNFYLPGQDDGELCPSNCQQ